MAQKTIPRKHVTLMDALEYGLLMAELARPQHQPGGEVEARRFMQELAAPRAQSGDPLMARARQLENVFCEAARLPHLKALAPRAAARVAGRLEQPEVLMMADAIMGSEHVGVAPGSAGGQILRRAFAVELAWERAFSETRPSPEETARLGLRVKAIGRRLAAACASEDAEQAVSAVLIESHSLAGVGRPGERKIAAQGLIAAMMRKPAVHMRLGKARMWWRGVADQQLRAEGAGSRHLLAARARRTQGDQAAAQAAGVRWSQGARAVAVAGVSAAVALVAGAMGVMPYEEVARVQGGEVVQQVRDFAEHMPPVMEWARGALSLTGDQIMTSTAGQATVQGLERISAIAAELRADAADAFTQYPGEPDVEQHREFRVVLGAIGAAAVAVAGAGARAVQRLRAQSPGRKSERTGEAESHASLDPLA